MVNNDYGMILVRTTSFGRKRVALPHICNFTMTKRHCSRDLFSCAGKSTLEDLPQEILIRIMYGVEHDDLRSLLLVSKTMRDAGLIAKQTHFAYSTPRKTVKLGENGVETPEAPKQSRGPRRRLVMISKKKLVGISVSLFASVSVNEDNIRPPLLLEEMETN